MPKYKYYTFYGGYSESGGNNNVVLGGDPSTSLQKFNLNMTNIHAQGYGQGIGFDNEENLVYFNLNLVPFAVADNVAFIDGKQRYIGNGHLVDTDYTYKWFLKISIKNANEQEYKTISTENVFIHKGHEPMYNTTGWETTASKSQHEGTFTIVDETTNIRFELYGEEVFSPFQITFTREQIIRTFKPWAIRKSNIWKTLNRPSGYTKIRKSNNWQKVKEDEIKKIGQANQGHNRIRKNGVFIQQNKKGVL